MSGLDRRTDAPTGDPLHSDEAGAGPGDDRLVGFFEAMCARHGRAATVVGTEERYFRVGGRSLCLRFASPTLAARLAPALEHLAIAATRADLTVLIWDSASSGVAPARSPFPIDGYTVRGDLRTRVDGTLRAAFWAPTCTHSMVDLGRGIGLHWMRDPAQLPVLQSAPLRPLLGWWAAEHGAQIAHAAAVGIGDEAILLVGRGGTGKSTAAVACLERGLRYVGDDCVWLRATPGGRAVVHSLYRTARLRPEGLAARLPSLASRLPWNAPSEHGKLLLLLDGAYRDRLATCLGVRAIVVPEVSPAGTALRPISAIEVLKALAPSTLFQLPGAGREALQRMGAMARDLPGYRLQAGSDLDQVVAAVRSLFGDGR